MKTKPAPSLLGFAKMVLEVAPETDGMLGMFRREAKAAIVAASAEQSAAPELLAALQACLEASRRHDLSLA